MSENESAVVNRAAEILGGKNSWTSDDLLGIERSLSDYGHRQLADDIRALRVRVEADRKRAEDYIAGASLKTDAARSLEKSLARIGQRDLAARVRARRREADTDRAVEVLGGANVMQPDEMFELAKSLAQYKEIGYARRVLKRACAVVSRSDYPKLYTRIFQKAALYTYKDPDLPLDWKLDRAFKILGKIEDLAETRDTETLGLAGAIFKRKWEANGKRQNLERALFYYLKGYAQGLPADATEEERADVLKYLRAHPDSTLDASKDQGWNGLNAAFILDVLAAQEDEEAARAGVSSSTADERRSQARLIREELARSVPPLRERPDGEWLRDEWWYYATVGEALFGLGRYEEAVRWLTDEPREAGLRVGFDIKSSAGLDVPEWEYESTARQLARLARLQYSAGGDDGEPGRITEEEFEKTEAAVALKKLLRGDERAVRSSFRGKFGLGLSGGGFRASLYHIGVLARLAELDVLRHVEVLSCVSGGSILGAHYYLEVRRLLQTKSDEEITREDYIEIVRRLEERFLRGVQRNIRTRVLAELSTNIKMIFWAGYSRTLRVGELYERELYSQVEDGADGRGPVTGPRWLPDWLASIFGFKREQRLLKDLYIHPKLGSNEGGGMQDDFNPRSHNWRRENKAPILVLNASSLNTGHTWQFTASYMGEPPATISAKIDCNYRLRRLYYSDAPPNYPPVRLGHAVAASSCVPGLFEPIILDDLYPDSTERRISVRLVDGGVCDNQGIASLLEQDCTVMLISDGSGQMDALDVPSGGLLGVPLRSNSILQARVREAQYGDIAARRSSSVLRGLMFVHLKQDLSGESVAWRDCPPAQREYEFDREDPGLSAVAAGVTTYGVAADTQRRLAAVRTDLDSFCDAEAYALMASAYRMTANQFRGADPCVEGFDGDAPSEPWRFLEIEEALKPRGKNKERLDKVLKAAANSAFKPWMLSPALIALKWVLVAAVAAGVAFLFYSRWTASVIPTWVYEWAGKNLTFKGVAVFVLTFAAFALLAAFINFLIGKARGKYIMRVVKWRDTVNYIAIGILMSVAGWLVARLHLHAFDPLYLRYGRIDKFPK
ncbi:MAG: patatin-like phospholipase family protein [Acidobacteriota bacterium]|nr:patatin-like phospholipase family protein [Acidobacteriota bacterium]